MKKFHTWLSLLLVLCMLTLSFAACSGKEDPAGPTAGSTASANGSGDPSDPDTPSTDSEEILMKPAVEDFDNYTYTMLVETNEFHDSLYLFEGDVAISFIDKALVLRQNLMEERYNITMQLIEGETGTKTQERMANAVQSNDYLCDVTMLNAKDSMEVAVKGYFYDVNALPNLNLDASYWDQRIQQEYRIGNMLFQLEGDFDYLDEMRTYIMAYNGKVYNDLGYYETYGSPYELVEDMKWTYATMMEMIADLGYELNHDGKMNEADHWGMVSEKSAPYYFLMGAGLKPVGNNNGEFVLNLLDATYWERLTGALDDLMSIGSSGDVLIANRDGALSDSDTWVAASTVFEVDQTLFRSTSLSAVMRLGDMTSSRGIMPIPAYFENQDGYYCWVNPDNHQPLSFFLNPKGVQTATKLTEALCYHSRYGSDTLYTAFFDHVAYSRLCVNEEDSLMLTLILESKTYDIDYAANFTGITRTTEKIVNGNTGASASTSIVAGRDNAKFIMQKFFNDIVQKCPLIPQN